MPDGGLTSDALSLLKHIAGAVKDGVVNGRLGGLTQCDSPRQIQLFGTISINETPTSYVPITTVLEATEQVPCWYTSKVERLWRIRTSGVEVQRFVGDPTGPLTRPEILGPATPAGASRGGSVTYKFRVTVCSLSGNYEFLMDAGQPIEVYGHRIQVAAVGPTNAVEVTPVTDSGTRQGLLIDSIVGASILASEASLGQTEVRFTQHLSVAAGAQTSIPVPEHAVGIKVYTGSGPVPLVWTTHIGDPAILGTALAVGTINFTGDTSADRSIQIGDATHVRTDINANSARFFTIVWTIRP